MHIKVKDGVIIELETTRILSACEADRVARANGFLYAERFVKEYDTRELKLSNNLRIIQP